METIEQMIDRVSEYESKRDSIEAQKRALLDEVKVPAEIMALQAEIIKKQNTAQRTIDDAVKSLRAECDKQLAAIFIPAEVQLVLQEIDRQRFAVINYQREKEAEYKKRLDEKLEEAQAEMQAKTVQVYADIARRKQEIEAEFLGKAGAVDENIAALKAEIQEKVLAEGKTYQGKFLMAVWAKGRSGTWNTGKLDGLAEEFPAILRCRNPGGEPTVTFRRK
jgi:hypothetical protein